VDDNRAGQLLATERARLERLLGETVAAGRSDRDASRETGDIADPAERLTAEVVDDAVAEELRQRLEAVARAENRLHRGMFGLSVRSGRPIPDDRLEADPTAELTREEAESG
jgi:DnaK suppressor protein